MTAAPRSPFFLTTLPIHYVNSTTSCYPSCTQKSSANSAMEKFLHSPRSGHTLSSGSPVPPIRHGLHLRALGSSLSSNFPSSSENCNSEVSLGDFSSRGPHLLLPAETGRVLKCSEWVDFEVVFVAAEIRWLSLNDGPMETRGRFTNCASLLVVLILLNILVSEKTILC